MELGAELREVERLEGHGDRVWSLAWNPAPENCGRAPAMLASCSGDKTVRIWQPTSSGAWDCSAVLEDAHNRTVRSCAWSPNGKLLATASFDSTIAIWEYIGNDFECVATLEPGNEYECVSVLQGHSQDVKMVQWHPNLDILVSVSYDNSIKVWAEDGDSDDWHCVRTLNESSSGHSSTVWALSFNTTGDRMVTCSDDLTLKIWNTGLEDYDSWRHLCTLSGYHDRTIFSVHWSSEGVIASGAADDAMCLFVENQDHSVDEAPYILLLKKEKAHDMDVNSEPSLLASASDDGVIKLWELSQVS
ncbi:Protein CIA1 [Ananas comosus]|uniref:Probable cytosolic iron-sulfur protein assembly protein CIAO1 homolog n=1 Tax=Ananas comosus TaxID=4615 RepID=A0A199UN78_ANACO|nr:Protein CIA1 [Ananas comosus]